MPNQINRFCAFDVDPVQKSAKKSEPFIDLIFGGLQTLPL